MTVAWPENRRILGTRVTRLDGPAKSTGRAKYSYDINRPGMLHGRILRCPHARAVVKSIDTSEAEKMPGVKAIHRIVKDGAELFFAGDEILGLAADTEEHANDALRAIRVEYQLKPALVIEEDALKDDRKTAPPRGQANVRPPIERQTDDFELGMAMADAISEGTYGVATICHQCLEPHGLVAEWDKDGGLTVWASTQAVVGTAQALAGHFSAQKIDLPANKVKCITHYVGGGFGSKFGPDIQGIVCAELARKAGAPVKLLLDRAEEVTVGGVRPSAYGTVKIGGTRDGTVTAYDVDTYGSPGVGNGSTVGPLPYVYPFESKTKHTIVRLNTQTQRAMRAPGHPQSCFFTDCALDDLAAKLGVNPLRMRYKNLPPNDPDAMKSAPTSLAALRNTIYKKQLTLAARLSNWKDKWHAPGKGPGTGPIKHGIGMALHTWGGQASPQKNECIVVINADGSVTARSSTQDLGTAQRTVTADRRKPLWRVDWQRRQHHLPVAGAGRTRRGAEGPGRPVGQDRRQVAGEEGKPGHRGRQGHRQGEQEELGMEAGLRPAGHGPGQGRRQLDLRRLAQGRQQERLQRRRLWRPGSRGASRHRDGRRPRDQGCGRAGLRADRQPAGR
jgi:xanthine dehydrogenase YagR molybdenum-binding subunit